MNVEKLQGERSRRPPPPPRRLVSAEAAASKLPGSLTLEYVIAMDARVRAVVEALRSVNSVLILDPTQIERQEEEAAAELYAALQEVSIRRAEEETAEFNSERARDEAYEAAKQASIEAQNQWKAYDAWHSRKSPEWLAIKAWEKHAEDVARRRALLSASSSKPGTVASARKWLEENPLPAKPPTPPEPPKPTSPREGDIKVTDLRKAATLDASTSEWYQAYLRAKEKRHQAEDYCNALRQKLSLIQGLQGARNHGI